MIVDIKLQTLIYQKKHTFRNIKDYDTDMQKHYLTFAAIIFDVRTSLPFVRSWSVSPEFRLIVVYFIQLSSTQVMAMRRAASK